MHRLLLALVLFLDVLKCRGRPVRKCALMHNHSVVRDGQSCALGYLRLRLRPPLTSNVSQQE